MGLKTNLLRRWLPKGVADLKELVPGVVTPDPLTAEYLILVVELRKREYLLEVEKLRHTKWWKLPKRILKVLRCKRIYRATCNLLTAEMARIAVATTKPHS